MWWHYLLVFLGALIFDLIPLPSVFTIIIFFQIIIGLDLWLEVLIEAIGSALGINTRFLYATFIEKEFLVSSDDQNIEFISEKIKKNNWIDQWVLFTYSLVPLPTTPTSSGSGISKTPAKYILPNLLIGKFISDFLALNRGKLASQNTQSNIENFFRWQAFNSHYMRLSMISSLLFIDKRSLVPYKNLIKFSNL